MSTSVSSSHGPHWRRLSLSLRTSLLCEFRDPNGVLQAFEVCSGQTTFGLLCTALSKMPGVEFPDRAQAAWFSRPSRFSFKGRMYEVSLPHENILICPIDPPEPSPDLEEVLDYVRHNVLRTRATRYTVR